MNILQQMFQWFLQSILGFFPATILEDIFINTFLNSVIYFVFLFMVVFVTFVPVYYSLYLLFKYVIEKTKKVGI